MAALLRMPQTAHLSCAGSSWLLRLPEAWARARHLPREAASHHVHGHEGTCRGAKASAALMQDKVCQKFSYCMHSMQTA